MIGVIKKTVRIYLECGAVGHIANGCPKGNGRTENDDERIDLALSLITPVPLSTTRGSQKTMESMLDSEHLKHVSNNKWYFKEFTPCKKAVQVGNIKVVDSLRIRMLILMTMVNETKHSIVLQTV